MENKKINWFKEKQIIGWMLFPLLVIYAMIKLLWVIPYSIKFEIEEYRGKLKNRREK